MTTKELKQQAREEFEIRFAKLRGLRPHLDFEDIWLFIDLIIDSTVAKERERIEKNLKQYGYYRYYEKMNIEIAQNQSQFNKLITKQ
jgi:hypothetical protein